MIKQDLISLPLTLGSYQSFIDNISYLGKLKKSSYVCVANVHMCIEAYKDSSFAKVVNSADIVTPDGKPLVFGLNWIYGIKQDKVSGPDLMPSLLKEAEIAGLKIFLYGASPQVLSKVKKHCEKTYPLLNIAGAISPPFRSMSSSEQLRDVQYIHDSGANIVFVALGCPKQEKWMFKMKGKINAVMIGVGGAFPMLVGAEKRAPLWMQETGLEWLYRLVQDPKRLFKRYLITNSYFIALIIKEKYFRK